MLVQEAPAYSLTRRDLAVAALLWLLATGLLFVVVSSFRTEIITMSIGGRWFQSDGWRVYDDMVVFSANHYRTNIRPLFSLLTVPATGAIRALSSVQPIEAVWVFNGLCLAAWSSGIYLACRLIGIRSGASLLAGLLALSSAAALFWFTVPETYGLSSLCLVAAVVLAAAHVRRPVGNRTWMVVGGLLAGTLITNWMMIVVLSLVLKPLRDAFVISLVSFLLLFGGWAVQKVVFPVPGAFPLKMVVRERAFAFHEDQGGMACKLAAEMVFPVLAPVARPVGEPESTGRRLTMQCAPDLLTHGAYPVAAVVWLALLLLGIRAMAQQTHLQRFGRAIMAMLGAQMLLHLVYGDETFLYALHFTPLLVVLAAGVFVAGRARLAMGAMVVLVAFAAFNNGTQLVSALASSPSSGSDPRIVERQLH